MTVLLDDIARIVALQDGIQRNYWITQRYHDLSCELSRILGGGDASWVTFATWASRTAGESIRGDEVPAELRALLEFEERFSDVVDWFRPNARQDSWISDVFDYARATLREVSAMVAAGNLKVFAELGPLFARFAQTFAGATGFDPGRWEQFAAPLRPGPVAREGQDLLRSAFERYARAIGQQSSDLQAQSILLANCEIGLHEQTRLQVHIQGAMDAPLARSCLQELWDDPTSPAAQLSAPARAFLAQHGRLIREAWERIATRAFLTLGLPGNRRIKLGEDLRLSLGMEFPRPLQALQEPALKDLFSQYDPMSNIGGEGACDWSSLDDRMRFIIGLFRTLQQDPPLATPPFTPSERALFDR